MGQIWCTVCVGKDLLQRSNVHSCVISGCFQNDVGVECLQQRPYGSLSQKYLLSCPLPKMGTELDINQLIMSAFQTHSVWVHHELYLSMETEFALSHPYF